MKPDVEDLLREFPKALPVFPVSEVVLFPGAVLPLHIFEKRYRRMIRDVMEADRLLALALLKRCSPEEYLASPPFHETVCVGHVVHHERLPDGRSNIVVLGLSAARAEAVDTGAPYRTARVELLADTADPDPSHEDKLRQAFDGTLMGGDGIEGLKQQLSELVRPDRMRAALVNTCALTAPILPFDKLGLLEERSLARRLDRLLLLLRRPWQWN